MAKLTISRKLSDEIENEAREEYQRFVESVNRATDKEIEDARPRRSYGGEG